MPIKFRCGHCNQLMGIARRKAGTQVRCPACRMPVTVPDDEGEAARSPVVPAPVAPAPALFERADFEEILKPAPPAAAAAPLRTQPAPEAGPAWPPPPPPAAGYDVERVAPNGNSASVIAPVGILVTPGRATVLTVVGVLLLGAAFAAGFVLGRLL